MKTRNLLLLIATITVLTGMAMLRIRNNRPPELLVKKAGRQLAEAKLEKSPNFARDVYLEASKCYDNAIAEWQQQNEKMILFRDYRKVAELARESAEKSSFAIASSKKVISNAEKLINQRINATGRKIKDFEEVFGNYPMTKKHIEELTKCKLLFSESSFAFENKNYVLCNSKLDSVAGIINHLNLLYNEQLESYFKAYVLWNEMVAQTIAETEKYHSAAVIVDKFSRKLSAYKNGKFYREYEIELGANWIGDKMQQGDKSTPEGMYKVVEKKQNGQTKYHKALVLNYPNEADQQRFLHNKKNGILGQGAKIGNLIEIHGHGGKGLDWTDGCIAVTDAAMDELYTFCAVGTRITIVGSVRSLNELTTCAK